MRVALTRERGGNDRLRALVGSLAEVTEIPLTVTDFRSVSDVDAELRALDDFGDVRTLVVTSARCARYVPRALAALAGDAVVLSVGPSTTAALRRCDVVVAGESLETALDLGDQITVGPVLILGAVGGRDELARALRARDHRVALVECYTTVARTLEEVERLALERADVVFIGAPSAWRVARSVVAHEAWVLVPGRTTYDAVRAEHDRVLVGWGEDFAHAWRTLQAASD